jgi:hypothetical protein
LDLGSIFFQLLIEMDPNYSAKLTPRFLDYLLTMKGGTIVRELDSCDNDKFLEEYLTDPVRAGKYVLDGSKYALVARFLLDCFIEPCSECEFLAHVIFVLNYRSTDIIIQLLLPQRICETFRYD